MAVWGRLPPEQKAEALAVIGPIFCGEGTTFIPEIGMTFGEAAARVKELLDLTESSFEADPSEDGEAEAQRRAYAEKRQPLTEAIFSTRAQCMGDVLAKLERLCCPLTGMDAYVYSADQIGAIVTDIRNVMFNMALDARRAEKSTIIPGLGVTFAEAASQIAAILSPFRAAVRPSDEEAADITEKADDLTRKVAAATPETVADALAVLSIAVNPSSAMRGCDVGDSGSTARALYLAFIRAAEIIVRNAGSVAFQGATPNSDEELLSAAARVDEIYHAMNRATGEDIPDEDVAEYNRLTKLVAALPAHTVGGVRAKLQIFTYAVEGCVYSYIEPGRSEGLLPQFIRTALEGAQRLTGGYAVAPVPLAARDATDSHDAEILATFAAWKRDAAAAERLPSEMPAEEREVVWDAVQSLVRRMEAIPAMTPNGVAAKLLYLFAAITEDAFFEVYEGEPPKDYLLKDHRYRMLWKLIGEVEKMGNARSTDTEIMEAGRRLDDLREKLQTMPEEEDPNCDHPLWGEKKMVEQRVLSATPRTGAEIGVLLRIIYDHSMGDEKEITGPTPESEWTVKALWSAIQASERLGGTAPLEEPAPTRPALTLDTLTPNQRRLLDALDALPEEEAERQMRRLALMGDAKRIHGQIMDAARPEGMFSTYRKMLACHLSEVDDAITAGQQPDGFADTISAFQGEAEKALSLPAAPTVDMLEAGAAAAGIDIEQARAIYAAMAEAYKKDAA
ncbi:hypothetical protein [Azospirillum argentinense]